jgi:peptidoglycan hydrolase-like protein with peptidoglycan-binding domain
VIRTLQQNLTKVGCYHGAGDGTLGPMTTRALRNFQTATHLNVDGIYGPNTEGLLAPAARAGVRICVSGATTTTTTTASSTTTTTTSASTVSAPCTAAAIGATLQPGETLNAYQCGGGWAAGSWTNSMYTAAFLLRSANGAWVQPPSDACANAVALGIPAGVLNVSPCKVS